MRFLCKIGWHEYKEIREERMRHVMFGFAGCEAPAIRVVEECVYSDCKHIRYVKLNIMVPDSEMKKHHLWHRV